MSIIPNQSHGANSLTLDCGKSVKVELVDIPTGNFMMGSNDYDNEKPIHEVNLSAFRMSKYPITQKQYLTVMGNNPSRFKGDENCPVEKISWHDAVAFCQKLSQMTGQPVKIPSEAQWEYACRAGSIGKYCFGDDANKLGSYAWYSDNSERKTHPVGEKLANSWGLHDMHGNIWEWCEDTWHYGYDGAPSNGDAWVTDSIQSYERFRVVRGGTWYYGDVNCRSTFRLSYNPDNRYDKIGFRVVL